LKDPGWRFGTFFDGNGLKSKLDDKKKEKKGRLLEDRLEKQNRLERLTISEGIRV
jgi:hypothetical protein